jgi:TonB family protein
MTTAIVTAKFRRRVFLAFCLFAVAVPPAFASDDPPIRVARLNYVEREVSFQPGSETGWSWAAQNRPMTTGDSLWTGDRSRAEMHIGSTAIRMDELTFMSFLSLDDRTVQIQLNSGTIDVRVRNLYRDDVFEVDTPNLAFTIVTRGDYRITVDPEGGFTTITLRDGQGQVTGGGQAFVVERGSQVQVSGTEYVYYDTYDLPGRDDFDQWSYSRDLREDRLQSARYVSPELTGYEDLDQNGTWRTDRRYGSVWVPTRVSRGWAPYREGHWAWVGPWGWTWVDDAPFGFVTSHYGRWAYVDDGYGSRGWAWVPPRREANQDVYARRCIYSPALVIFVGESNSPRGPETGGRVAWFPLAPGEVYVPAYETSQTYITNVNVTNTVVQQTTITNVVNNIVRTTIYVNQSVAGALTVVPRATFVNAQPVARAAVNVAPGAMTAAPVIHTAPVAPVRASVMGGGRPMTASAAAESAPPRPPETVIGRPVVAKVAPPPPPVAFAREQQALQAHPGKPLDATAEQNLRAASPQRAERAVRTAPPAPAVKPAEPSARKPQPATSPNRVQQARPSQRGGPPAVAEPPQAAEQQLAAEKAKQQAAQQPAAQQQVAAENAKQGAEQQQRAQQAGADKAAQQAAQQLAAQQQAAAENARQGAEQQQRAQQAAADKAARQTGQQQAEQQQAAAGKAKQAAADKAAQQAAQQLAAQQQAAAENARQGAEQQQRAQQAAADKAAQQAAQQLAAQQQAAAENVRQGAEQQQRAQQAAADKAARQTGQQQAEQQQAVAGKAQQAAADKAAQQAAQQLAAQQQAAAEKTKQDAAQQTADNARPQKVTEDRSAKSVRNVKPPAETPPASQPAAANSGPIHVAENVQAAKLLSQPKLNYPSDAKATRIQGTVRVHVLIGGDGKVKTAAVLSGPQPLRAAALENARQRQYQPTMVGGQPVEVETDISIKF